MLEAVFGFQHILETIRCFGTGLPFHALHLCDNLSFIGGIFFRNRHHTYDLEYTLFVAFPECICWDSLESVTTFWFVLTLSSIHFLHSGGNLKNLFLRLSVLQSISGIFSRFFLLHCTCIFSFSHKISSFFCSRPYYYAVSRKISFVFPSFFPAAVSCFCTKLSGICTKQNIFCTKTGGNSSMFFLDLPYFLFRLPDFFGRSLSF